MTDKAEIYQQQNASQKEAPMREVDGKKEYLDEPTGEWVTKNEIKKRQTQRKKEKEAAEKAAAKKPVV
jgi:lysyl-tRNA synthetase class 2